MGLVELSLVSQEPPYWGWLKPLFLEDLDAAINVSVFPKVYEQVANELLPDSVVRVKGRSTSGTRWWSCTPTVSPAWTSTRTSPARW